MQTTNLKLGHMKVMNEHHLEWNQVTTILFNLIKIVPSINFCGTPKLHDLQDVRIPDLLLSYQTRKLPRMQMTRHYRNRNRTETRKRDRVFCKVERCFDISQIGWIKTIPSQMRRKPNQTIDVTETIYAIQ